MAVLVACLEEKEVMLYWDLQRGVGNAALLTEMFPVLCFSELWLIPLHAIEFTRACLNSSLSALSWLSDNDSKNW